MTASAPASLYAAIFLLSFAALLFQFVQTRLFSTMLDYHLTFLVVSGALLGVAAGAAAAAAVDGGPRRPSSALLAAGAALATIVALAIETRIDPMSASVFVAAGVAYVLGVFPVLLVSWVIVRALRDAPTASGSLYAADLAGAACGAVLGYLAIGTLGGQGLYGVVAAASLGAGAALLSPGRGRTAVRVGFALAAAVVTVSLSLWGETLAPPRPGPLKVTGMGVPHEYARWDPLARIDILREGADGDPTHYAFLIDEGYKGPRPPSLLMTLDMGAITPIMGAARGVASDVLRSSLIAAPYQIEQRQSALIVGPGGGVDILNALVHGVTAVTGVEVNRTEVALMRGAYADYSGGLYLDPRVRVFEDEARSFVRRSPDRYDVIAMTVVDSYAALTAGAYALTENYLYTAEAMHDYLTHLSPLGMLAVTRWYREPPLEIARTVGIAEAALRGLGRDQPERSIAVLRYGNLGLVLVRNEAFTSAEMQSVRAFADAHRFTVAFDPFAPSDLLELARVNAPPTDDRPFFFDTVSLGDVMRGETLPYGYGVLFTTLILSGTLAVVLALLPVYRGARRAAGRLAPPGTVVALMLGVGFIAAELVLIQRLTLFLGQPSLALSIGLAALLGGAASGSAMSTLGRIGVRVAALASSIALLAVLGVLPFVTEATLAAPLEVRVLIAAVAAYAVGLPLGMVFPRLISDVRHPALVSWVWAANGTASVVGAAVGTMVALAAGFTGLGLLAVACYVIAALFAPRRG